MNNRRTLIGVITLVLLGTFGAVAFALQTSAADLLVQSLERIEAAESGHAVINFEADTPEESGSGIVEVWGQLDVGPNGEPAVRVEVLEASIGEMAGATAVTDGTQFWLYNPQDNQVIVGTFAEMAELAAEKHAEGEFDHEDFDPDQFEGEMPDIPENAQEAVDMMLEYFTAERAGTTRIGEDNAIKVRLIPIPEQMPDEIRAVGGLINVYIRRGDTAPLGAEFVGSAIGSGRIDVSTLELDINVDPSVFTFEAPAGAEIIHFSELEPEQLSAEEAEAAVDFELLTPAAVPAGAELRETTNMRGAIVQRYSFADGRSFTVTQGEGETAVPQEAETQSITLRGVEARLYGDESGTRTLLSWNENGITFWIGGDLTADEAIAIADSLQ